MTPTRRGPMEADEIRSVKETLISLGLRRSGERLARTRLPGEIDRSWRRSISAGAARDAGAIHYVNEFDTDSRLRRAAGARPARDDAAGHEHRDLPGRPHGPDRRPAGGRAQ